ncbi:hypothetical protein [Acinetobacter sp. S40]|nr:hypothetical protein [Acinetobacter sp. S40]
MFKKIALKGLLISGLVACHTFPSNDSTDRVQVTKSLQGKQCESSGIDISMLKQQLEIKHIHVYT